MTRHEEYMKQAAQQSDSVIKDIVNTTNRISNKLDMVNSPPHYNKAGIECIDAIRAATSDGYEYYLQGNIIKYLWRYRYKNGVEDLKKAQWYLDKLIEECDES
tara:strand:- start:692 stop:1000 length:309 start_codon:yes stop_codon:yes gene_type:complete